MIKKFGNDWPILFSFVLAALVALWIWIYSSFIDGGAEYNLWLRVYYGAAALLVFKDVIETAYIAWGKTTYKNLDFWMFAFYVGYFFTILMILMFWRGIDDIIEVMFPPVVAGVAFGIAMAFICRREKSQMIWQKYDLENPMTKTSGIRRFVYYVWPIVVIGFIWLHIKDISTMDWKANRILFQIIFMASILQIYPHKSYRSVGLWQHIKLIFPKLSGYVLLIFGLYMF